MTASEPRFGRTFLLGVVAAAKSEGYRFFRVDEKVPAPRAFCLRFDVDISPRMAREVGTLLADEGIAASFFFQLNAETYNPFAASTLDTIRDLRQAGHCVGLHIDQALLGEDEKAIAATLDWYSACCTPVDRAISFHRPTPTVLGRQYVAFASAYGPPLFAEHSYFSDSRRTLDFAPGLLKAISERKELLQLLLHPEWWSPYTGPREIWEALRERRRWELETYVVMNFRKVFGPILDPRDQEESI